MEVLRKHPFCEVGWIEHELSRTKSWIEEMKKQENSLRREWVQARLDAGENVHTVLRESVGLE